MRKTALLNSNISSAASRMGHTDMLTVVDCGLSIPDSVVRAGECIAYANVILCSCVTF